MAQMSMKPRRVRRGIWFPEMEVPVGIESKIWDRDGGIILRREEKEDLKSVLGAAGGRGAMTWSIERLIYSCLSW